MLKERVLLRGCFFIDVYELTVNEIGENNAKHLCPKTHLSPRCLSTLFDKHLYKIEVNDNWISERIYGYCRQIYKLSNGL